MAIFFPGLVTGTISMVCLIPLVVGMLSAKRALSQGWNEDTIRMLSGKFEMYFQFPASSLFYGRILGVGTQNNTLFIGGVLLCLSVVGLIAVLKRSILNQRIISVSPKHNMECQKPVVQYHFPSTLRKYGIFNMLMAVLAFLLSLGMTLTPTHTTGLGVYRILVWLSPYNFLYKFIPGFSSIRSPNRFSIFIVLFLAILAGTGMLWLCRRIRSRWRWILIVLIFSGTIFELWPVPLHLVKIPSKLEELPRIYQKIKELPSDVGLIEFPLATSRFERGVEKIARYMYFSTFHWHPFVDGYATYAPRSQFDLMQVLASSKTSLALFALKAFGVQYVAAHWDDMTDKETQFLRELEEKENLISLFQEENRHTLYQINNTQTDGFNQQPLNIERFAIYESDRKYNYVTLCFYYQMTENQFLLVTPWENPMKNPIECEVSWYRDLPQYPNEGQLVLVKNISYRGSRLLHADSNTIVLDVPAPSPGKYRIVVKHTLGSHSITKTGICEIYPQGFVTFHEEL